MTANSPWFPLFCLFFFFLTKGIIPPKWQLGHFLNCDSSPHRRLIDQCQLVKVEPCLLEICSGADFCARSSYAGTTSFDSLLLTNLNVTVL